MKKKSIASLTLLALVLTLFSCQKESVTNPETTAAPLAKVATDKYNVFKGPEVPLGDGYARSWIRISHTDQPSEIGVEITAAAMSSLPSMHAGLVLPLHKKAKQVTPFDHVSLDYQPNGHPPAGVFTVPHFDVHFYLISLEEQMAIPAVNPSTLPLFNLAPPTGYMPPSYSMGAPEPQMGTHWIPPPPTFVPFSRVMIYGTYNGSVKFIEPMVTVAHMMSGGSTNSYLQPQKFERAGNYPTMYNVYTNSETGNYNITLSNFVARTAN
jgi:hypothetical protein